MFCHKQALSLLILCSLSLLTLSFNPQLQKSYFYVEQNSSFSYEFSQTHNGIIAHHFDAQDGTNYTSKYFLFDLTSKDAYPILENTVSACQKNATPAFSHLHYHIKTDTLVYFCAANSSLLFINQAEHTVQSDFPLNINNITWPVAKLPSESMSVSILVMDTLFKASPQSSALFKVVLQTKTLTNTILFNQNLTDGEAVVEYATANKGSYIATRNMRGGEFGGFTFLYSIIMIGNTYQITPLTNFTNSRFCLQVTKLFTLGDYIIVTQGNSLTYFNHFGQFIRLFGLNNRELTKGVYHPVVASSNNGSSLYFQADKNPITTICSKAGPLMITRHTIIGSVITTKDLGIFQNFQLVRANQTSNDLMFTYDPSRVFFNILDLQTFKNVYTAVSGYSDLMLTETTYAVVQTLDKTNSTFYIFDLKTNTLVNQTTIGSFKYFYNKEQHLITFFNTTEFGIYRITHIDLVSGKAWTSLEYPWPSFLLPGSVIDARMTENGNLELVHLGELGSRKILQFVSETHGELEYDTHTETLDTYSVHANFDDMSFTYFTADQAANTVNVSVFILDEKSNDFKLNVTNLLDHRPVKNNGLFTINQDLTVILCNLTLTVVNKLTSQGFKFYTNNFNLVTGFEDNSGTVLMLFSYFSADPSQYPQGNNGMIIFGNEGKFYPIQNKRNTTVSGQAVGPKSFALFDYMYSSVGVVRLFNSDGQDKKTIISILVENS